MQIGTHSCPLTNIVIRNIMTPNQCTCTNASTQKNLVLVLSYLGLRAVARKIVYGPVCKNYNCMVLRKVRVNSSMRGGNQSRNHANQVPHSRVLAFSPVFYRFFQTPNAVLIILTLLYSSVPMKSNI